MRDILQDGKSVATQENKGEAWLTLIPPQLSRRWPQWTVLSMLAGSARVTWCSLLPWFRLPSSITGAHSTIEQRSPEVTHDG